MFATHPSSRRGSILCAALVAFTFIASTPLSAQSAKIMAIGDSITEGLTGHAGWRYWMCDELTKSGLTNFDLIGSKSGAFLGPPLYPNFDQDHESHWGARADQLLLQMPSVLARGYVPDIVLIHAGHNDIFQGESITQTAGEILALIATIREANRDCQFYVAKVIPPWNPWHAANLNILNTLIELEGPVHSTPYSTITVVDQASDFDINSDLFDGVHPNASGERKIADRWVRAIAPQLSEAAATMTFDPAAGRLCIRNLAGIPGADFFNVLTSNPANANGGFGNGWFGGVMATWEEVRICSLVPDFNGVLDNFGSSSCDVTIAPGATGTLYLGVMMTDPLTGEFTFGAPSLIVL